MAEGGTDTSTIDLGEDLNCAICMQILFQPLTLLDCMHTFCGACLKDWFAHQAADARSLHPYTCPSCRDSVRATKRYPFIMNMLEKHLNKNPDKVRSEEDKQEHMEKYKAGDNVLPKLRLRHPPPDPEEERAMNEAMAQSLRDAGITDNTLQPADNRRRGHSRGARSRTASRSPGPAPEPPTTTAPQVTEPPAARQPSSHNRQIEHQSSLISLLSVSEMDPQDMQEEILRQIEEEGLLNDVDLTNLDASQTEELSERIARAYQRRREETQRRNRNTARARERSRQRDRSSQDTTPRASSRSRAEENVDRPSERRRTTDPRPPISNPQLIDSANQGQTRHRRSGSATSTRSAATRVDSAITTASPTLAPILPSAPSTTERRRRTSHERSATDPNRGTTASRPTQTSTPGSAPSTPRIAEPTVMTHRTHVRQRSDSNPQRSPRLGGVSTFPQIGQSHSTSSLPLGLAPSTSDPTNLIRLAPNTLNPPAASQRPSSSSSATSRPTLYSEPSITCNKCGKTDQEYEVHYNCPKCSQGKKPYNLCKSCFRRGEGCPSWWGFGSAAQRQFEAQAQSQTQRSSNEGKPHVFTAERYQKPRHALIPGPTPERPHRQRTEEDPSKRLEKGVFCDLCSNFANNCYWKCDACNDGEWGFCNNCVNQGKHCTHPLLPLKAREEELDQHTSQVDGRLSAPTRPDVEPHPSPPLTPKSASIIDGPVVVPVANLPFRPLTFHTVCDICTIPIPPSVTRYHCPQCNGGDYDICMNCYHGLVSTGKISATNGPQGWRKCPEGHRMVIIGFQDAGGGQRRVVDRDLVGGWTFVEDANNSTPGTRKWRWNDDGQEQVTDPEHRTRLVNHIRTPPDGGIGLVFYSRWNYFPDIATEKDLCFPKNAEIREAEDINGDWLWGVYAGKTGLFPSAYVNFLRRITM